MNVNDLKLNKVQTNKWIDNLIVFIAPVATIYIVSIIGLIQANNGGLSFTFFIPNEFTLGAGTLYILNFILDYLKKKLQVRQ